MFFLKNWLSAEAVWARILFEMPILLTYIELMSIFPVIGAFKTVISHRPKGYIKRLYCGNDRNLEIPLLVETLVEWLTRRVKNTDLHVKLTLG